MGAQNGRERENDRGGIAARVGDEAGRGDGRSVQFRGAVDRLGLDVSCGLGVGCLEHVDCAVGVVLPTPGGGEIDDAQAASQGFGDPGAGLLVGGGQEEKIDGFSLEIVPGPGFNKGFVGVGKTGELRMEVGETDSVCLLAEAAQEGWWSGSQARVAEEDVSEFGAGVACDAGDRDAKCLGRACGVVRLDFGSRGRMSRRTRLNDGEAVANMARLSLLQPRWRVQVPVES